MPEGSRSKEDEETKRERSTRKRAEVKTAIDAQEGGVLIAVHGGKRSGEGQEMGERYQVEVKKARGDGGGRISEIKNVIAGIRKKAGGQL